ncbi:LysR family transcriptional regulator [Neolewinella persica]|uniref:LysR family transcriptional regulator n=1 Tax=Neolewinella persica TaxID=70998 RepID=UPI00035FDF18|nr:LysR family transcriptional regulator [Neolewinella persica]
MNYTIHQLRIFIKVCDYQSITKASEALYLTQPAVSIQLKKLQNEFEIPLTEVIGRQLHVTEFGQKIRQLAQNILEKVDQIEVATDHYKGVLTGNIRIASASTGKYVIPYFLASFMRQHPGVNISIDVTNKMKVVESLQENSVDFALVSVIPQNLNLTCVPLIANELYLVGAQDYPGLPKRMMAKNLGNYPLIFREKGSATLSAMKTFLNKNQVQVKRSMTLVSNEAVKQAVRAGLGLSIMPLIGIRSEIKLEKMKLIPIKGLPVTTQWNLTYSSGKQLSPACQALVDYIQEHKDEISKAHFI